MKLALNVGEVLFINNENRKAIGITMYYIIYETVNLKNGKRYRGRHQTDNVDDGYLGSGTHLAQAIAKYGSENFIRCELFYAFDYDGLLWAEKELVDKCWVERCDTYNIVEGGGGSYTKFIDGQWINVMQVDSVKKKREATIRERYPDGLNQHNLFSSENNPGKDSELMKKMVSTRRDHPLGYHQGKCPFPTVDYGKVKDRMITNNPMKTESSKQKRRESTARKYGFSNDQQLTNYINDLYHILAMTPAMIVKVIGCDASVVERRCVWVCRQQD